MSGRDWSRRPTATPGPQENAERDGGELDRLRVAMAMRRREQQRRQQAEAVPETAGAPLEAGLRAKMEGQLGADLSDVRVHDGSESAAAADKLGARAFTRDKDVHFGAGEYAPGTKEGDRLIAHELAHVAQGKAAGAVARKATSDDGREGVAAPHDASEREADEAADSVAATLHGEGAGRKISLGARPSAGIHRKAKPDAEAAEAAHAGAEPGPKDAKKDDAPKDFSKMSDDERWKAVQDFIKASPTGQHALDLQKKYSIAIKWQPGGGSYYDSSDKSMVLDSAVDAELVALNFVHEMNHAEFDKEGKGAEGKDKNISTMSREDYVAAMLDEEVKGTCLSIETKMELEAAGQKVASKFPLEDEYRAAYDKATGGKKDDAKTAPKDGKKEADPAGSSASGAAEAPKADAPKAGGKELDPAGKKAGYDAVLKGFKDGLVVTSNTNEKYPDYYGSAWDKANKGKTK